MQDITEKQLKYLLEKSGVDVILRGKNGEEVSVGHCISFDIMNENITFDGYDTEINGKIHKSKTYNSLIQYLKKVGAVGEIITLLKIGDLYDTIEELEEAVAFERLNMRGILEKYLPIADSFELVAPFEPTVKMTEEEGRKALELLQRSVTDEWTAIYDAIPTEDKALIPPMEALFERVESECKKEYEKCKQNNQFFDSAKVLEKCKKPYADLEEMWEFYNLAGMLVENRDIIERCKSAPDERKGYAELELPKNVALKKSLLSVTPTFCWHCTVGGNVSNVFRFALNKETAAWLAAYQSDYDLEELEDLAFYKGDKLLFSSCTHECFHTDFSKS